MKFRRRRNIPHISTGAMLREAIQAGTPLGLEVKQIIESGALIGDEIITRLAFDRLREPDTSGGFLLDGYPRTIPQAEALDAFMGIKSQCRDIRGSDLKQQPLGTTCLRAVRDLCQKLSGIAATLVIGRYGKHQNMRHIRHGHRDTKPQQLTCLAQNPGFIACC